MDQPDGSRVAAVMAVHGHASWVEQAVESVLSQTYGDLVLYCSLDGPNDSLMERLSHYPSVRTVVSKVCSGPAEARNLALRKSSSKYVAVIDSDDVWPATHIEEHVAFMEEGKLVIAAGTSLHEIDEAGRPLARRLVPTKMDARRSLLFRNQVAHSSSIYLRAPARDINYYDPAMRVGEDYDLWLRLGRYGPIATLGHRSVSYRIHRDQASTANANAFERKRIGVNRVALGRHLGVPRLATRTLNLISEMHSFLS